MTSLHHLIAASFWRSHATPARDPFARIDPGMRLTERDDLIRCGLPIDEEGKAIVEGDEA